MEAAADDFSHLLGDDAGHGVGWLEENGEAFGEVGYLDTVAGAEEDDHGFSDDAAEGEHDGGEDAEEGSGQDDAEDCLAAGGAGGEGGLLDLSRDVPDGLAGQGEDGGNGHEGEQAGGGEGVELCLWRKEGYPAEPCGAGGLLKELPEDEDSEEAEDNCGDGGDEFNGGLDPEAFARRGQLFAIDGGTDADGDS